MILPKTFTITGEIHDLINIWKKLVKIGYIDYNDEYSIIAAATKYNKISISTNLNSSCINEYTDIDDFKELYAGKCFLTGNHIIDPYNYDKNFSSPTDDIEIIEFAQQQLNSEIWK